MEKEKMRQNVRELIWDYILNSLENTSKELIPNKELKCLPLEKNQASVYTYIFIIERYLSNKIIPVEYEIKCSNSYSEKDISEVEKKSISAIKKLLTKGDKSINSYSRNFIPSSIKKYFQKQGNVYVVDFSGSIWGIKHLHLNPNAKSNIENDTLLYYVIIDNTAYFIKIGKHSDLYNKTILEIMVNDFPEILPNLGIYPMPDMPMSEKTHNYSAEEVKNIWQSGGNISYTINNKYYTSSNIQSTANLPAKYNYIVSNISYQIEHHIELFLKEVLKDGNYDDAVVKIVENNELGYGKRLLTDEKSKSAIFLNINYLKNMDYAKMINAINLEK